MPVAFREVGGLVAAAGDRAAGVAAGAAQPVAFAAAPAPVGALAAPGAAAGAGDSSRIEASSRCSQGCSTALGARSTGAARTSPVAGRNRVSSLAVPPRTYSCGRVAGSPTGAHEGPACGIAW